MGNKSIISFVLMGIIVLMSVGCSTKDTKNHIEQGFEKLGQLEYEAALEEFEIVSEATKEQQRLLARGKGIAYAGLMQYEEALGAFEEALGYSNGIVQEIDYDINYYIADVYYKQGDYEQAIATYDTMIELRPEEQQAHYLKGLARLKMGTVEEACGEFEIAMSCKPDNYELLFSIMQNLSEVGEGERGKVYLQQVIDEKQDDLEDAVRGRIYYYLADYEMARISLESAKGSSEEVTLILGQTYEQLGDLNYATLVYEEYVASHPESAVIYNQLAICYRNQALYEQALEAIESGLLVEDSPMRQTLLYNEIVIHEYLQDYHKATVLMEAYLEKYPTDEKALREYEFLSTR